MDHPRKLFELPVDAGLGEAWEVPGLASRFDFQSLAAAEGAEFKTEAMNFLLSARGLISRLDFEIEGFPVDAEVVSRSSGHTFLVLARGTPDLKARSGFRRTDTVQKAGFVAMNLAARTDLPILLITSDLPQPDTKAELYLRALKDAVWDCVATRGDFAGFRRLQTYMTQQARPVVIGAPWKESAEPETGQQQLPLKPPHSLRSADAW